MYSADSELVLEFLGLQLLQVMNGKGQRFSVLVWEKASCFSMMISLLPSNGLSMNMQGPPIGFSSSDEMLKPSLWVKKVQLRALQREVSESYNSLSPFGGHIARIGRVTS